MVELILMPCDSEFDNVNFYFGGDDFSLTVSRPGPLSACGDWSVL